jgi:hypothetical protein
MTQDEIIEMAKPFLWIGNVVEGWTFNLHHRFAVGYSPTSPDAVPEN